MPSWYSLADCRSSHTDCVMDEYADDTVLTGLMTVDDDSHARDRRSTGWCSGVRETTWNCT